MFGRKLGRTRAPSIGLRASALAAAALLITACGDGGNDANGGGGTGAIGGSGGDAGTGGTGGVTSPWIEGPTGTGIKELAGDFTVQTLDGPWNLRENWTGEESVLFFVHFPGNEYSDGVWNSADISRIFKDGPVAHYVFLTTAEDRTADLQELKGRIDAAYERRTDEEKAAWAGRIHFVTDDPRGLDDALGDFLAANQTAAFYGWGIDRDRTWREAGYLANVGTGKPHIRFLARAAAGFDYERAMHQRINGLGAKAITVFDGETHAGGWAEGMKSNVQVTFPPAEEMAGYDSMAVYMYNACPGHLQGKDAGCNEWDYSQSLMLCDAGDPTSCDTELVRYVTPYGREGEWLTDVSPLLPLVNGGGTRTLQYVGANGYEMHVKILLWNAGKPWRPVGIQYLWGKGANAEPWNESYDALHPPVTFTIDDPTTSHVEIFASITGHGFGAVEENCAEFCNHQHEFSVNGTAFTKEHPEAGTSLGCFEKVEEGVVPNQFGTWPFGRGGWCPGQDVKPWGADVSSALVSGENTIAYRALFEGQPYTPVQTVPDGYMPELRVASWLVTYVKQ